MQARSHLLHLREGYLETRGRSDALADLIVRSAPPLAALLKSVARLEGQPIANAVTRPPPSSNGCSVVPRGSHRATSSQLAGAHEICRPTMRAVCFRRICDAVERLTPYVDRLDEPRDRESLPFGARRRGVGR